MTTFIGRFAELRKLNELLDGVGSSGAGRRVVLTGAAGVGKSRLVGEFLRRARVSSWVWAAPAGDEQLADFVREAQHAPLAAPELFGEILVSDWDTAFRLLGDALDPAQPTVVVLDNTSLLHDRQLMPALRRAWAALSQRPILMILSGRESAGVDGVEEIAIASFNPAELAKHLGLDPFDAFDAYLASGGHPDIAAQWPTGSPAPAALAAMVGRSPSVFEIRAELTMARSWPAESAARAVLQAIGAAECSRAALGRSTGLAPASLDRALKALAAAGEITVDRPVSAHPSREARYRLADPYLRAWMQFLAPKREELARGRDDLVIGYLHENWETWRMAGMRIVAREAMDRLAAAGQLPGTEAVGGYWTRFDDVQVDLVGVDGASRPAVTFVGTLIWDRQRVFDHYDLADQISRRDKVPGAHAGTPLVGVTAAGSAVGGGLAAVLGPAELLTAWGAS